MISGEMYKVLSNIPHYSQTTDINKLARDTKLSPVAQDEILQSAREKNFIEFDRKSSINNSAIGMIMPDCTFYLSESGKAAVEEYENALSIALREEKSVALAEEALQLSKDNKRQNRITNIIAIISAIGTVGAFIVALAALLIA